MRGAFYWPGPSFFSFPLSPLFPLHLLLQHSLLRHAYWVLWVFFSSLSLFHYDALVHAAENDGYDHCCTIWCMLLSSLWPQGRGSLFLWSHPVLKKRPFYCIRAPFISICVHICRVQQQQKRNQKKSPVSVSLSGQSFFYSASGTLCLVNLRSPVSFFHLTCLSLPLHRSSSCHTDTMATAFQITGINLPHWPLWSIVMYLSLASSSSVFSSSSSPLRSFLNRFDSLSSRLSFSLMASNTRLFFLLSLSFCFSYRWLQSKSNMPISTLNHSACLGVATVSSCGWIVALTFFSVSTAAVSSSLYSSAKSGEISLTEGVRSAFFTLFLSLSLPRCIIYATNTHHTHRYFSSWHFALFLSLFFLFCVCAIAPFLCFCFALLSLGRRNDCLATFSFTWPLL